MKTTRNKQPNNGDSLGTVMPDLIERGHHDVVSKQKSLQLAEQILKAPSVTANEFEVALNALQTHSHRLEPWRRLIDSAYERLSKCDQHSAWSSVSSYTTAMGDHSTIRWILSKPGVSRSDLLTLVYAMEAALTFNRMGEAGLLVQKCKRGTRVANKSITKAWLLCLVGDYYAKTGDSATAFAYYQKAEQQKTFTLSALTGRIAMRVLQAVQEIDASLTKLDKFTKDPNNKLELMTPGFERDEQDFKIVTELHKFKWGLKKILSKVRMRSDRSSDHS